jgi:serine/threonine protein kinase
LGLLLVEILTGEFPYPKQILLSNFDLIEHILNEDPPSIAGKFSNSCAEFSFACLTKDYLKRPKPQELLVQND